MPGTDTGGPLADAEPPPEEIFAAVGDERRIEILWMLYDAYLQGPPYELSFSELHSRISADMTSSQSNYHLQQLVGHFVKKTNYGYRLHTAGKHLCQALRAGVFHTPKDRITVDAEFYCHYCQTPVEAIFDDERVDVQCPGCEYIYIGKSVELPIEEFEDAAAAFTQFSKYIHHKIRGFARGVCTSCGNALGAKICQCDQLSLKIMQPPDKVAVDRSCDHCGHRGYLGIGVALLTDPELICFCYEHGVDVLSTPFWELEFAATSKHTTVLSSDPWEVALHVTYGGDTLELIVDGDLNIVERNRR